jgi:hypothetical protein
MTNLRHFAAGLLSTTLFVVSPGLAADESLRAVKGLYLDREHHPALNGMRFDIELERPEGGSVEVPVTYEFHSGQRIWLRMDMRNTAYVYVLNRTLNNGDKGIAAIRDEDIQRPPVAADAPRLVFGPEKISRGAARRAPKSSALRFDLNPGIEKLYVILSPKPLHLESLFGPEGRMLVDDGHRDSLRNLDNDLSTWAGNSEYAAPDKEGAKGIAQDNYGYCVERRPNEALMFEITLAHSR